FTAAFFLLLTFKLVVAALVCGVIAVASILCWLWSTDPGATHPPVEIGGGIKLPVYLTGPTAHSWWAMIVLILVAGAIFGSLIFSYLFLWTVLPDMWPARDELSAPSYPLAAGGLLVFAGIVMAYANRALKGGRNKHLALAITPAALIAAFALDFTAQWQTGLRPGDSGYGAAVYMVLGLQGFFVSVVTIMAGYVLARSLCGLLTSARRATFDNTMLFMCYTVAQGLIALALVHGFPRLL
ncbi:MAG: cytochrome ubiquinol oxidase subunit I, partial [Burkholderiales bacterium]